MNSEAKEVVFNAKQIMNLLEQAEIGCHTLFDSRLIRRALTTSRVSEMELDDMMVEDVQRAIVELAGMDSVINQQKFIEQLPIYVQHLLVHLYFRFLDQFMHRREVTLH